MTRNVNILLRVVLCVMIGLMVSSCSKKVIAPESATFPASGSGSGDTGQGSGFDTSGIDEGRSLDEQGLEEGAAGYGPGEMNRDRFVNEDIFFQFDSSALTPEAQDILNAKADWMQQHPEVSVVIEGHCDSRGTNEYNIALGERRAEGVKNYIMSLGISGSRVRTISYGEERPLAIGDSEDAWAKNRRAHFEFD